MNTTKIIGEAVGVQWQGLTDRTETSLGQSQTSAIIVGRFKRGTFYKAVSVNLSNIRALLGYEPNNPDFIAVQTCLDTGVPSVQVLRVPA